MKKIVKLLFVLLIAVPTLTFAQQKYYWKYYTQNGVQYREKIFIQEPSRDYIPPKRYAPPSQYIPRNYTVPYYPPIQYEQRVLTADRGLGIHQYYIPNNYSYNNNGYVNYYPQSSPAVLVIDLARLFQRRPY